MTREEVKKILNYVYNDNYSYYFLQRILAETGIRICELINLKYKELNHKKKYIEVEGKTGRKIYFF